MTTLNTSALLSVDYGSSMSGTLNTGAGSNIQGAVFVMGDPSAITSVLVNGQAATPGRNDTGNSSGVTLYTAKNLPANSAIPVVVNFSNGYAESVAIAVALNDADPTTTIAFANGLATNYASPGMSVALTNNVNGTVLSFIATRTDTADAFSADTAHSATLIGVKSNGGTGAGAAYAALEMYPAGATSTLWNWTASGGSKPATQMAVVINPFGTTADTTPPTITSAAVANSTPSTVTLTASENLASASTPASAFTVAGHTVQSVAFSGAAINLTVTPVFVYGEAARNVTYTQPGTGNVTDVAGNLLANITTLAVTNNVAAAGDTTPPSFVSAQVLNSTPNVIQVTMTETLASSVPPNTAFTVSGGKTVTGVSLNGTVASLTVSANYAYGDTITVAYTQPGANPRLQDAAGNATASFAARPVTNNIAQPAGASFTFGTFINNTNSDQVWLNQAVVWSWHQAGRVGQASTSVTYGSGTIGSNGLLVATGLPAGAGFGLVAKQNTGATDDAVYYQAGTAA